MKRYAYILAVSWWWWLAGCGTEPAEKQVPDPLEATLDHLYAALAAADTTSLEAILLEPELPFLLAKPVHVDSFRVVKRDTVDAAEAARYEFLPPPRAGDCRLDIWEFRGERQEMYTYWFRPAGDSWKLFAWASWESAK